MRNFQTHKEGQIFDIYTSIRLITFTFQEFRERYWKKIDKTVKNEFVKTFNDYIILTYAPKFKGWQGEFKAVDALIEKDYFNVKMNVINKNGPILKLIWKIYLDKNKNFKILDVNIDGVSMLITQRAEFMSVIKNNPNGVLGLIEAMKKNLNLMVNKIYFWVILVGRTEFRQHRYERCVLTN